MSIPTVITITYSGEILSDVVTTSPWRSVTAIFPEYGSIPYNPQFFLDVLQPPNTDGARYRIGGAHFPVFRLLTIVPATNFTAAQIMARDMDAIKGDRVLLSADGFESGYAQVINVRAVPSAKRVINASAIGGQGVPGGGATDSPSYASVDTEWTLQVVAQ